MASLQPLGSSRSVKRTGGRDSGKEREGKQIRRGQEMFSPAHKHGLRVATIPPDCDYSHLLLRMGVSVKKTEKYVGYPGELGKPFKCSKENTIYMPPGRSVGEKHPDQGSLSTKSPPPPLASPFSGIFPQEPVLSASWRGGVPGSWRPRESRAAGCRACPHPSSRACGASLVQVAFRAEGQRWATPGQARAPPAARALRGPPRPRRAGASAGRRGL